jgi:anti-sigma factor RsiW
MSCAHAREELGGYVLGALEPAEREAVAAHLAECPECAAEHERLAGLPAMLAPAAGLEIPPAPPAVEERLLDRVATERRRRRHVLAGRRLSVTGARAAFAAALAGAALGAGATALALTAGGEPEAAGKQYAVVLRGDQGASARAELMPGGDGTEVHMWVRGLPAGGDAVYEVRCERPGWSASAGTFRANAEGRAYVVLTTAARLGEYERIRVVRRPQDTNVMAAQLD